MLLPKVKLKENEEEEDPRKELIDKLLEYKKFKAAAYFLRGKKEEAGFMFSKKPEIIEEKRDKRSTEDLLKNVTMLQLYNLYNELINRYREKINTENRIQKQIPLDRYKIEDKMDELIKIIVPGKSFKFRDIPFESKDKLEVVVTFLALLELIKIRAVSVVQENNFNDIYIEGVEINDQQFN